MNEKGVSFIICTYNGKERILPAIKNIISQNSYYPFELLVVDNNSDTNNHLYLCELQKQYPFRLITEKKQGLLYAKNTGVSAAKYQYIAFIDDDNYIQGNWTDKIIEKFEKFENIGAIGSKNLLMTNLEKLPHWFDKYKGCYAVGEQWYQAGFIDISKRNYIWGAGMVTPKNLYLKFINNYANLINQVPGRQKNSLSSGEDGLYCKFLIENKYQLYYYDELILYHNIHPQRINIDYLLKLNYNFGKSQKIIYNSIPKFYMIKNFLKLFYLFFLSKLKRYQSNLDIKLKYYYLKGYLS